MVIDQFNIEGLPVFKTENDPPVRPNRYGPKALAVAFELVKTRRRRSTDSVYENKDVMFAKRRDYALHCAQGQIFLK